MLYLPIDTFLLTLLADSTDVRWFNAVYQCNSKYVLGHAKLQQRQAAIDHPVRSTLVGISQCLRFVRSAGLMYSNSSLSRDWILRTSSCIQCPRLFSGCNGFSNSYSSSVPNLTGTTQLPKALSRPRTSRTLTASGIRYCRSSSLNLQAR